MFPWACRNPIVTDIHRQGQPYIRESLGHGCSPPASLLNAPWRPASRLPPLSSGLPAFISSHTGCRDTRPATPPMSEPCLNYYTTRVELPQNAEFWPILVELEMSPLTRVGRGADTQTNRCATYIAHSTSIIAHIQDCRTIELAANDVPSEQRMRNKPPSEGSRTSEVESQSNP